LKRWASLAVLVALALALPAVQGQSIIPTIKMTIEPEEVIVDASGSQGTALFNCTVQVEGMPYVRYRVNLTAVCEGWCATCSPNTFTATGSGNFTYTTTVVVPQGEPGGESRQLNVTGSVSAPGFPAQTCVTYAFVTAKQSYGIDLSTTTSSVSTDAGKAVTWQFSVKNNGNGRDSISLTIENLSPFLSAGWALRLNRSLLSLDAGQTAAVSLSITPPENSKDQTVSVQVKGSSRGAKSDNLTIEDRTETSITVKAVPGGGGGGGGNNTDGKKFIPGPGVPEVAAAMAFVGALFLRQRRRREA